MVTKCMNDIQMMTVIGGMVKMNAASHIVICDSLHREGHVGGNPSSCHESKEQILSFKMMHC